MEKHDKAEPNIYDKAAKLIEEHTEDELIELISAIDLQRANFSFTDRLMAKLIDTIVEDVGKAYAFDDMPLTKQKLAEIYREGGLW